MNVNDFMEKASDILGYVIATLTDEYIVDTWPMTRYSLAGKEDKTLEIRVFNKEREDRLIRTDISKDFAYREAVDEGKDFFDEYQYIDIDKKGISSADDGTVTTTGGGEFNLPIESKEEARLMIRYYLDKYQETGHVKLSDWRMVDLVSAERAGD